MNTVLKNGNLSIYGLGCGYVQRATSINTDYDLGDGISCQLYREGCVYHVKTHDFSNEKRLLWQSFDSLSDARACFNEQVVKYNLIKHINF